MSSSTSSKIFSRLLKLPVKFFVDIGASNCPSQSQTEDLAVNGWSGIMFECSQEDIGPLTERMKPYPVTVIPKKVTPDNIIQFLQESQVPDGFYLSLDIDGYDFFVLQKILSVYKPQLIISEINEKIPPPIKFTVNYDPSYWWDTSHFYGYSLSMLENIKGYKVESLDFNNVIMTPGTQEIPLDVIYRDGYWNMPRVEGEPSNRPNETNGRPSYNADFDPIYTMSYMDQIDFIQRKFAKFIGKYTLDGIIYNDPPKPKYFWNRTRR
jgi:hypothetical protein